MNTKRFTQLCLVTLLSIGCGMTEAPEKKEKALPLVTPDLYVEIVSGNHQVDRAGRMLPEPLVVKVRDGAGQSWKDQSIEFFVYEGDATLVGGEMVATDEDGLASVQVQLGLQPCEVRVVAILHVLTYNEEKHQVLFRLSADPIPAPQLVIVNSQANGQRGVAGTNLPIPFDVMAQNEDGIGVVGETIYYTVVTGSPSTQIEPEVVTNNDGIASSTLYLGTEAGPIEIRATWLPDPDSDPNRNVTFYADTDPDNPALLEFVSGHQSGSSPTCAGENEEFVEDLVVRLTDQYGNPISDHTIEIDPDSDSSIVNNPPGASITLSTNEEGEASFRLLAGDITNGSYDDHTTVEISTLLPSGSTGPSNSATLDFTQHRYFAFGSGTSQYNYGWSFLNLFPPDVGHYLNSLLTLVGKGTCYVPLANQEVAWKIYNVQDACPAPVSDWGNVVMSSTIDLDPSGLYSGEATLWTGYLFIPGVIPVASRMKLTIPGSPSLYYYAGWESCQ